MCAMYAIILQILNGKHILTDFSRSHTKIAVCAMLVGHCICNICTIVTLAFPTRIHPSRTTGEAIPRMRHNDSPAATALLKPVNVRDNRTT